MNVEMLMKNDPLADQPAPDVLARTEGAATATTLPLSWLRIDAGIAPAAPVARPLARHDAPRPLFIAPDAWRERAAVALDGHADRLADASRRSSSPLAFRPALSPADWRILASYCVARRLPAGCPVLVPGAPDRTLRFVIEGGLEQVQPASGRHAAAASTVLSPGCMVGEDALFAEGPGRLDVRALEDSLVLELPWPRQAELTAAHRAIAFELLRAAGAVIAARVAMLMGLEGSPAA